MSDLPPTWRSAALGDLILDAQNGCGKRSGDGTATVVLRLADVGVDGSIASEGLRTIGLSDAECGKYALHRGDLLAFRVNGSRDITGRVVNYNGPEGYAYCDHFIRIRLNQKVADSEYVAAAFREPRVRRQVELRMVSTAGQNTISQSTLRDVQIPLPSVDEQRRIVVKLESLQARSRRAREALDAVPHLLEKLRQSILAAAFRGDLTQDWRAQNPDVEPGAELLERIGAERRARWDLAHAPAVKRRYPAAAPGVRKYPEPPRVDSAGLPPLPPTWCWAPLATLISAIEAGRSPKAQGRPAARFEAGVLKVSAVTWGRFDPTENKALLPGDEIGDAPRVRGGDLLISRANTAQLVGAVALVPEDHPNLMLSDKILRLVPSSGLLPKEFLLHALRTRWVRDVFEEDATGTSDSMRNLSQEKILSAPIPVPPPQEAIAIVGAVESAMASVARGHEFLKALQRSLTAFEGACSARAFRGEFSAPWNSHSIEGQKAERNQV